MSTIRMLSAFARGSRTYGASYTGAARPAASSTVNKNTRSGELREQVRALKQSESRPKKDERYSATYEEQEEAGSAEAAQKKRVRTVYTGTIQDKQNGYLQRTESRDKKKEQKLKKPVRYNYKEVAGRILRAKTPVSAGQALLAAKRKVVEMKRKIASKEGDPDELQFALTHAKRMEIVARKKKHHLELEELAEHTQEQDERTEASEEAAEGVKDALISEEEEKLSQREDEILEEREDILAEAEEEGGTEEMLAELNEMLSEYGEETLKELEEAMELMESLEFMDPHMSEEELEELKRKHRNAENKAIVKADMDYLKDMIRHQLAKGAAAAGALPSGSQALPAMVFPAAAAAAPASEAFAGGCVDIQI